MRKRAKEFLQKNAPEKDFQASAYDWLERIAKCYMWRQNQGGMKVPDIKRRAGYRWVAFTRGAKGISDLIGINPEGIFVGVECKSAGGKATEHQSAFIDLIRSFNGIAIVADNLEDLEREYIHQRFRALNAIENRQKP